MAAAVQASSSMHGPDNLKHCSSLLLHLHACSCGGLVAMAQALSCRVAKCRFPIGGDTMSVTSGVVSRIEVLPMSPCWQMFCCRQTFILPVVSTWVLAGDSLRTWLC